MVEEKDLGREGVDAIHHTIVMIGLQEGKCAFVTQELLQGFHLAVGVDVAETVAKQDGFGLPDGGTEGYELAVEVGLAHRVAVHKGQMAHSCPTELFGSIAAHSTQSDNKNMGRGQTVEVGLSEEQRSAGGE